jgi:hypothetical protein
VWRIFLPRCRIANRRKSAEITSAGRFPLTIRSRNSRCLCSWAVMLVTKHNLPESERDRSFVVANPAGKKRSFDRLIDILPNGCCQRIGQPESEWLMNGCDAETAGFGGRIESAARVNFYLTRASGDSMIHPRLVALESGAHRIRSRLSGTSSCDTDSEIPHHCWRCGWEDADTEALNWIGTNASWPMAGKMSTQRHGPSVRCRRGCPGEWSPVR